MHEVEVVEDILLDTTVPYVRAIIAARESPNPTGAERNRKHLSMSSLPLKLDSTEIKFETLLMTTTSSTIWYDLAATT